jgi:autotransporter-associated beta strand protein
LACSAALASAADIFKADNADALNLGSSWSGGTAPGAADVAVWNNLVSAANATSSLGADLSWAGIRIANPGAAVLINAGNTLTNGAAGIDLSAATQDLTLDNNLEVGASQTWNIGSGRVLTISTPISGAGTSVLTKGGAGTLALTSTVNGTFSGATVVNGGVLQLNSANGNNNSALGTGIITNNGATLRLGAARIIGNALHFNGNCIVDANGFGAPMDGAWSGTATVQIINLTNSTATFTIGGNGNGGGNMNNFTGTIRLSDDTTGMLRFNNGGGNNNVGNASATFDFGNSSAVFFSRNRNATVNFGELIGGPNTTIRQGASSSGTTAYSIGAKNTSTTFAGQIIDGGTAAAGLVAITKVGTGTLTLTGTNTYL